MNKKKKLIIITLAIGILLIAMGLFFVLNSNKKDMDLTSNTENGNSSQNDDINDSLINKDDFTEENIKNENKDESTTSGNSTSENGSNASDNSSSTNSNNSSSDQTLNTPITIESTFTQKVIKTSEDVNLKYWLYTPKNPTDNMPLIVYLHGGSARGDDLNKVVEGNFPKFLKNGELGSINAYVIMPQVPSSYKGWSDIKVSVRDLITNTRTTYGINQNKISLTGHSIGGKGTYDIALAYPNIFSCIAPMSGSITVNDININKLKNIPIWAFVGSNDTIVDPSTSTNFLTEIMKYNSKSKLTIFDEATHFDVPDLGYKNTDVINWLINNSK